ncbi:MAG TPA: lytic transglycosylase [Prevotella sp.]|nr:lytic transglycosylase domain-containing protein [uncultured Prevotella sp.]HBF06132.1 lytic transglycosylase [Candidatus Segatella violae]
MKKILIMAAALLLGLQGMQAQTDSTEDDDDVITVTDKDGKAEEIEVPEGLEDNLDSLLHLYNAQTYLMPDTSCNYKDVNPVFEREVYIDRLKRLPTIIEMPYNDVVQKFIDRYSGKLRRSVSFMLGASNFYMPIFEEALEAYNLPLELKYLPVIESALNPKAVSRVGATGLWQFMLPTGKRYGLEVNTLIDERRDPVKASYAAAHYLSDLYKIFDDWSLVIAAYNCGPTNVNKAIHRAKGNADYWNIYPYLPKETRGYVPAFIAANYIMNYYCDHNICPMVTELPTKTDTVVVDKDIHFEQIAQKLNIDIEHLRNLNPQYRHDIINGLNHPMTLRLPSTLIGSFIDQEDSICAYKADELLLKRTLVDVNDDVPSVGRSRSSYSRHSSSSSRSNRNSSSSRSSKKGKKGKKGLEKRNKSVTIKSGDTLSEIAARNGTTVKKLRKLNGISGNSIRAGKKLKVK